MKKIALIVLLVVIAAFAGQTEAGIINVKETKYGTEMTFWPNKAIEAGHVYSVVMEDYEGFKSIEIKFMNGTVQTYVFDSEKIPSVTVKSEDRVLSWDSLTLPKFMKTWNSYMKYFKNS
jgi:hypothetical protein